MWLALLWQLLTEGEEDRTICTAAYPAKRDWSEEAVQKFENTREAITLIRAQRSQKGMSPKEALDVTYSGDAHFCEDILSKLANLQSLNAVSSSPEGMSSIRVKQMEFYLDLGEHVNLEEEKEKLEKEMDYLKGFLKSVTAKLSNERFVSGAPAMVVDREKAKKADAEAKIKAIEQQLSRL